MTFALLLTLFVAIIAVAPAALFVSNWFAYRPPPRAETVRGTDSARRSVSLLIPARNESATIAPAVECALASVGVDLEVIVLDDESTDDTAAIVSTLAARDSRVRLLRAPPLPPGWCGKQHACHLLAAAARNPLLAFVDADVRLAPAALSQATAFLDAAGSGLVSGFPHQESGSLLEKLLIPLIHFVLLSYLPLRRSRRTMLPSMAAGCGQFFLARRDAYDHAGGHAAIRSSLHDGIMLPRLFRRHGIRTDLFDAESLATCRMYHSSADVWHGLAKNATEGMAAPVAIIPWTFILLGGQVLPLIALVFLFAHQPWTHSELDLAVCCAIAGVASYGVRAMLCLRFGQSWLGAMLHPIGVILLVLIQWYALGMKFGGRPAAWKGRMYRQSVHTAAAVH